MLRKKLTLFAALAALSVLPAAAEVTLDEIIVKHIASKGGLEAIKAIDTLRITANMQMGPGMEAPITMESRRPDSLRVEFEMQGMKGSLEHVRKLLDETINEPVVDDWLEGEAD